MQNISNAGEVMVGRKEERLGHALEVKIPTFFRCPISLDVMQSPVSLCTGVTYDRASIQRWLDSGNTTCPATAIPLPSTDLVPNLTLRRLIHLWSSSPSDVPVAGVFTVSSRRLAGDLLQKLRSSSESDGAGDPVALLRELAGFFSSDDVDEIDKNRILGTSGCIGALVSLLQRRDSELEMLEAAIRTLVAILTSHSVAENNKKTAVAELAAGNLEGSVASLVRAMKTSKSSETRLDAATVLEAIIAAGDANSRAAVADREGVIPELIRLIGPPMDRRAVETGLGCLAGISTAKRVRPQMAAAGAVQAAARLLADDISASSARVAGRAMRVMEAMVGCAEGRAAICEEEKEGGGAAAVVAVARRMMKAGMEGAEAAVAVLWSVCHRHVDRRAARTVVGIEGMSAKLLLLMQSGCSPAARGMAADLLKMFRVNSKGCLTGYDTKTTHIMPF